MQAAARDMLIFGEHDNKSYHGGIRHFDKATRDVVEHLLNDNFLDPLSRQNDSSTAVMFLSFMNRYRDDELFGHGYVVSPKRPDYRVTFEGLTGEQLSHAALGDFAHVFHNADDLMINSRAGSAYCWWD